MWIGLVANMGHGIRRMLERAFHKTCVVILTLKNSKAYGAILQRILNNGMTVQSDDAQCVMQVIIIIKLQTSPFF